MLSRKIYEPIKMILPGDDAIAPGADYVEYLGADPESGDKVCDEEKLQFVNGRTPTRFTLRPMTHKQRIAAHGLETMSFGHQLFVVRCGLVRISDYEVDGAPVMEPARRRSGDLGELVTEEWLLSTAALSNDDIGALAIAVLAITENKRPLLTSLGPLYGARV